jgi:hypothetical protein
MQIRMRELGRGTRPQGAAGGAPSAKDPGARIVVELITTGSGDRLPPSEAAADLERQVGWGEEVEVVVAVVAVVEEEEEGEEECRCCSNGSGAGV